MERGHFMRREVCLRCGGEMTCMGQLFLKKGAPGWHLRGDLVRDGMGDLLPVELWCCQSCQHLDFYLSGDRSRNHEGSGIAQIRCPGCGILHDMDDAKCPHCGKRLY